MRHANPSAVLIAVLLGLLAPLVRAEDDLVVLVLPVVEERLVLDGRPDEAAWKGVPALKASLLGGGALDGGVRPTVRVLVAGDRLWIAAEVNEAPGPGVGLALMIATEEGAATAADAVAVAFAPQSVRAARWVVHGPRGTGRETYRVEGAVDVGDLRRWSVEVVLPLADLGLADSQAPLRLAVVVRTRVPSRVAWAPPGAAYRGPATWLGLRPADAWPLAAGDVEGSALAEADRQDADRLYAWSTFGAAYATGFSDLLEAAGHPSGAIAPDGKDVVISTLRSLLLEPLEEIHRLRPDLAYAHVVRGGVLHQMGLEAEARQAFGKALAIMPGLREATFGIHLDLVGPSLAGGPVGGPTDYASAFAVASEAAGRVEAEGLAAEGVAFGTGLLHLAHGDFAEALALLEPLARRYPFQQSVVYAASRARLGLRRWSLEARYRQVEAQRDDLPRVRLATTKGEVVLELYEDDAGNTVKNFVWLVTHGFYDGSPVARTVPCLLAEVGGGDPGWAVATQRPPDRGRIGGGEPRRRRPYRGTVAMLSATPDAAASRFVLLTGTAPDLEGDLIPFGWIVEGQAVVEALEAGDRIEKASVLRSRPGTGYRPLTVKGTPAPAPR